MAQGTATPSYLRIRDVPMVDGRRLGMSTASADNTAAFQAAVNAAGGGGMLLIPYAPKTTPLRITSPASITGLSDVQIVGHGDCTVFEVAAGRSTPFIDFDACSNVTLRDFCVVKAAGANNSGTAYGVRIRGSCSGINLERLRIDGMVNAVRVSGVAGAALAGSAVQTIRYGGAPTGGTHTLGFWPLNGGDLQTTGAITYSTIAATTASNIQAALVSLAGIGTGNVTVTAVSATEYTVSFGTDQLAGLPIFLMRGDRGLSLTGGDASRNVTVSETTKGGKWVQRIHLDRVTALNSPNEYGIALEYVDGYTLSRCYSAGHYYDGLKGIRWCHNGQILGGEFSRNGRWYLPVPVEGGGIDLYAGGEFTRIKGVTCNENGGSGILLKNDSGAALSGYGSGKYGLSRKLEVIGVHACRNQNGAGLNLTAVSGASSYSTAHVTVSGGLYEDNAIQGVVVNGRNITLNGVKARRNRSEGIYVGPNSKYIDLNGCQSIANSTYGLTIEGQKIRVRGGTYIGTDNDALTDGTDETTLTKTHTANIRMTATASDVVIDSEVMAPEGTNNTGRSIQITSGATDILAHQRGTLTPGTSLIYGSPGTKYFKTDTGVDWVKISGAVDAVGVWGKPALALVRVSAVIDFPSINAGASNTQSVTVTGAAVGDDVLVTVPIGFDSRLNVYGVVTSTNNVGVVAFNPPGQGAIDASSGTFTIKVFKD